MKEIIIFGIIALLLISTASSQMLLTPKQKLKDYADTNFKPALNYKNIAITSWEKSGNITIINLNIDGKKVRWITNKKNFDKIIK